jgi:hypothetical protein
VYGAAVLREASRVSGGRAAILSCRVVRMN